MKRITKHVIAVWRWSRPRPSDNTTDEDRDGHPGLDVVAAKITAERQIRLATYDALGIKAGVIATATVALTALTASGYRPLVIPGLACAAAALALAMYVVWPHELDQLDVEKIRGYMTWPRRDGMLKIADTETVAVIKVVKTNRRLAKVVGWSFVFLALSAILLITAAAIGNSEEPVADEKPAAQPSTTPSPTPSQSPAPSPSPTSRKTFSTPSSSSPSSQAAGATETPPATPPLNPDVAMIQTERRGRNWQLGETKQAPPGGSSQRMETMRLAEGD